jgi:hypothetical protein
LGKFYKIIQKFKQGQHTIETQQNFNVNKEVEIGNCLICLTLFNAILNTNQILQMVFKHGSNYVESIWNGYYKCD